MGPNDIFPDIPLEAQGKVVLFNGATCAACGFRYAEHEGHIIPCPRCAAANLERQVEETQGKYERLLNTYRALEITSGERLRRSLDCEKELIETKEHLQHHTMTHAEALSQMGNRLARLEEEKAQIDACAAQWARENAALVDRLAQAEAREAVVSSAAEGAVAYLEAELKSFKDTMPKNEFGSYLTVGEYRALTAEVEKLREVARAASREHQPDGYRVDGHDHCPMCAALANVRGEEGE